MLKGAILLEWSENLLLYWGLGAYLSTYFSFCACVFSCELLIFLEIFPRIKYVGQKDRGGKANGIPNGFGFCKQFLSASVLLLGPAGMLNCVFLTYVMVTVNGGVKPSEPSPVEACLKLVALKVLDDFIYYWGHRVMHESEFLWQFHRIHHQVTTPTAVSTGHNDLLDATISGGLPIILASAIIQPSPWTFYLFVASRVSENVLNHSGICATVIDVISFKFLPFRAGIAHHDAHHKFSNYHKGAKNLGELLWVWDWIFGTLSNTKALRKEV